MVVGVGVDLVDIQKIKKTVQKWGDDFLDRIFCKEELEYLDRSSKMFYQRVGARFAAKEAFLKATGGKLSLLKLGEIEVITSNSKLPRIELSGAAQNWREQQSITNIYLSDSFSLFNCL